MSRLIEELKTDHSALVSMLNKVKELGISSVNGQKILVQSKETLLTHLNKEDRDLYPVLRKAAENDKNLRGVIDLFAKDMEIVSKAALDFFNKYSVGRTGIEFAIDYGRFLGDLKIRMKKEEVILYPEYERINP